MARKKKIKGAAQTWVYLWLVFLYLITKSAAENTGSAKPGCNDVCGDVTVPYPFGIDELSCAMNKTFFLTCNRSVSPPTLNFSIVPITSMSKEDSTMVGTIDAAYDCYDGTGENGFNQRLNLRAWPPFMFSNSRNKFTTVGCDALAYMGDYEETYASGCLTLCEQPAENLANGSTCSSTVGCCQTTIPKHVQRMAISISSSNNHTISKSNPCSFAFLLDTHSNFSLSDEINTTRFPKPFPSPPVAIEWVISRQPDCEDQCSLNAECVHSENALGYRCSCVNN